MSDFDFLYYDALTLQDLTFEKDIRSVMACFEIQSSDNITDQIGTGHLADATVSEVKETEEKQAEIVTFVDMSKGATLEYNAIEDSSFYTDEMKNTSIEGFMSRPLPIHTIDWSETGFTTANIFPWKLYFQDPRIKRKLDNYAFVSCNLHLKIVVNASPFYYGAAIASYTPLQGINDSPIVTSAIDEIPLSQLPHIWIYPQTNTAGEMHLPFFYYQNWLDATSAQDLERMGMLTLSPYTNLLNANGVGSATATIQIFAWATDVRLAGPTVKLAVQSEDIFEEDETKSDISADSEDWPEYTQLRELIEALEKAAQEHGEMLDKKRKLTQQLKMQAGGDEWGTGPVSLPASAVAAIGNLLSDVPVIGTYAKATDIGFSAVSRIASLFGWTNVPVIKDVVPYKSLPFHGLASAHIASPVVKLTLDPKNELTVDPRTVGLDGCDELAINYLVQRESYVTSCNWATTNNVNDTLFSTSVLPQMHNRIAITGGHLVQEAPMAHFSHLFENWRGDVIFRFKFICTQYHKGRIRITWDPVGDIITDADSTPVAFTQVVDLSETTDFEVRIPYLQQRVWLRTWPFGGAPWWYANSGFSFDHDDQYTNGTLTVRVLTELLAPVSTSTIQMFVFARGAENLEFANPHELPSSASYFAIQSQDVIETTHVVAGEGGNEAAERYLVNFGEAVPTVRLLMRRSVLTDMIPLSPTGTGGTDILQIIQLWQGKYPAPRGYDPNGWNSAKGLAVPANNFPFNFAVNHPFNWVTCCFTGMRGSLIWHYNVDSRTDVDPPLQTVKLSRAITTRSKQINESGETVDNINALQRHLTETFWSGCAGQALTTQITQGGLSALLPQYNPYRMVSCQQSVYNRGQAIDHTDIESFVLEMLVKPTRDTYGIAGCVVERYVSIGTDFNCFFFRCVPTMWAMSSTPAANVG